MITILLATYNGSRYLPEQLDSVINQTESGFVLHISDDCSTDNTLKIANAYAARNPRRVIVKRNAKNSGNAKHNFLSMMLEYKDDYVMLCDQDDIWLEDKIELTLARMREMEFTYGKETPLLVHTDLRIVDQKLATIHESFRESMNANYNRVQLRNAVIQNTITGCTVMYNRALADLIDVEPTYCVMHDWWLMLIASAFGKIGWLDNRTMLYRQHGANVVGAKNVRTPEYMLRQLLHVNSIKEAVAGTYRQAESFLHAYSWRLTTLQRQLLSDYAAIPRHCKLLRAKEVVRLGTYKNGFFRRVAQFAFI